MIISRVCNFFKFRLSNFSKRCEILRKKGLKIGDNCEIYDDVKFGSEPFLIKIGNDVKITNGCKFITHDGGVHVLRNLYPELKDIDSFGTITIGNNVFFGNDCLILPNVNIGDNVVVGARAIVTKDVPSNSIVVGAPAKVIKTLDDYKENMMTKIDFTKNLNNCDKKKYLMDKYLK